MGFKEIFFDEITGEIMLCDENYNYLSDIYGEKKSSFKPFITGYRNYQERMDDYSKDPNLTIERNQLLNLVKSYKLEPKAYLPTIRKVEGYCHMPNPLINPLANQTHVKEKNKKKLIAVLKTHYKSDKVKSYFNATTNQGISYLTSPLKFDYSKIDRDKIIVKIDEFIEEYKLKNKYKLDLLKKDPLVIALRRFRKYLVLNENIKVIHGRKLPEPSGYIASKFDSVSSELKKFNLKQTNLKSVDLKKKKFEKNPFKNLFSKSSINGDNEDLSYLSHESENEKIYKKNNILKVKSLELIRKKQEKEDTFLQGFKSPPLKEEPILRKIVKKKYYSNGELYMHSMELLKKGKFVKLVLGNLISGFKLTFNFIFYSLCC